MLEMCRDWMDYLLRTKYMIDKGNYMSHLNWPVGLYVA